MAALTGRSEPMDVYVVWETTPDEEDPKPLAVTLEKGDADGYLGAGLLNSMAQAIQALGDGGLLSLSMSRGRVPDGDINPPGTFASFVINNPESDGNPP